MKGEMMIPASIMIAGLIIAAAVFFNGRPVSAPVANNGNNVPAKGSSSLENVKPVTKDDHIMGDINAPIVIVEYSDFECPFCGRAHPIIESIVDKYQGKVAWVYRHFPLNQIHAKATPYAEASECVAELGGNDAFWKFSDIIFANPPALSGLTSVAEGLGVDGSKFDKCMASDKHLAKIQAQTAEAVSTGGEGTPWSIVIGPNGEKLSVNGAQPAAAWSQVIDQLLAGE